MSDITTATMDILFRTASVKFNQVYEATKEYAVPSGICEVLPMSTLIQDFFWPSRLPEFRRWLGERTVNAVSAHSKRIEPVPWELTFDLLEEHVKFDQYNLFNMNIANLGKAAKKLIDYKVTNFLSTNTSVGYDGQPLFSDNHPLLGGDVTGPLPAGLPAVQSNINLNTALNFANYAAARAKMASLVGEDGRPLDAVPNLLVTGPGLESVAKAIVENEWIANATTNIPVAGGGQNIIQSQQNTMRGTAKYLMIPELARMPLSWFLFKTDSGVAPIMWGQLEAPYFTHVVNPESENVFMRRKFLYGARAWGVASETVWPLSYYATGGASYGT